MTDVIGASVTKARLPALSLLGSKGLNGGRFIAPIQVHHWRTSYSRSGVMADREN